MHTQTEGFLAETVDEQIEQLTLIKRDQHSSSEVSVVQDLHDLYEQGDSPEQVRRSLDNIWSRLADRISPEEQTLFSAPDAGFTPGSKPGARPAFTLLTKQPLSNGQMESERAVGKPMALPPVHPTQAPRPRSRRTLALSVMAAAVLLGLFSWVMVAQLSPRPASNLGGGPGQTTPTPTIPATPASQNLQDQAQQLLSQFHKEVTTWGNSHQYHNAFDGKNYTLDYAYGQQGIGNELDHLVSEASSSADYQAAIDLIQSELTNLHAMEANYNDPALWYQIHKADTGLLNQYKLNSGVVIVVSLVEQSMRVYQNGQLVKAFQITTGRYETPTLPGSWQVMLRQSPTTLQSSAPKGSPDWYPPTVANYVLTFHSGGYLIYDSWWRANYGQGTEFPHYDNGGNESFAGNGSNGGVNLSTPNMAWLYNLVQVNTPVIIY